MKKRKKEMYVLRGYLNIFEANFLSFRSTSIKYLFTRGRGGPVKQCVFTLVVLDFLHFKHVSTKVFFFNLFSIQFEVKGF